MSLRLPVVVVGAGLAGLEAARKLDEVGIDTLVVEARERVGGRARSATTATGECVDLGAQWLTAGQHRMRALADELGLARIPVHAEGSPLLWLDGRSAMLTSLELTELRSAVRRFDQTARQVPLEAPWRAPGAEELDRRTFGDWLESNASSTIVRSLLARISAGHHCTRCDEISLLHALFYARSNGGFAAMSGLGSAEKSEYLPDGAQELARRMAASLGGARLRLASPVVGIRHDVEGAVVFGSDFELQASRVIVAIPPTAAHRLRFDPRLTPERELLGARARMGSGYKVHAVFEEPFWRRDGRSGQALFEQGQTSDGSPPDSRRGILVALFEPSYSAALAGHSAPRRRREVLALLAELFGPAALHPLDYIETYWAREVFSGGDVCSLPIGTWSATRNALREPIGCVHWAGTETATEFYSHMEGALQSAERVVHEVQEGLENS